MGLKPRQKGLDQQPKGIGKRASQMIRFGQQAERQAPTNIFNRKGGRKGKRPGRGIISRIRRLLGR